MSNQVSETEVLKALFSGDGRGIVVGRALANPPMGSGESELHALALASPADYAHAAAKYALSDPSKAPPNMYLKSNWYTYSEGLRRVIKDAFVLTDGTNVVNAPVDDVSGLTVGFGSRSMVNRLMKFDYTDSKNLDMTRLKYLESLKDAAADFAAGRSGTPALIIISQLASARPRSFFPTTGAMNKYLVQRLKAVPLKATSRSTSKLDSKVAESGLWDMATGQVFFRDNDGQLARRDPDGKVVTFTGPNASDRQGLSRRVNCYNTGRAESGPECDAFIHDCLLNDDSTGAVQCLNTYYSGQIINPDTEMTADIQKIHPVIAYRILQKFGFRYRHEYDDVAKGKLKKVEKVSHWKKHVVSNLTGKDKPSMTGLLSNHKMEKYLNHLVQFVNANPAILNERYTGKSEEATGHFRRPEYLTAIGVPAQLPARYADRVALDSRLRRPRKLSLLPSFGQGVLGMPMAASATNWNQDVHPFVQMGGDGQSFEVAYEQTGGSRDEPEYLEGVFKTIQARLADQGKEIESSDVKNIDAHIDQYRSAMQAAQRMVQYVEAYSRVLEMMGDEPHAAEVINYETMQQLVDKYQRVNATQESYETQLQKILVALEKKVGSSDDFHRL